MYQKAKRSYTNKIAERNKAVLKSYLISVGNLALLDKDVHCAKRPRETKGNSDTDIIVYNLYEKNWVFINEKNIFAAIKSLEITLLSKVVSRHFFWPSLNEDRTFSGWYCKKYYYHSMKLHGPIELTNASKWVSIVLFDVLTVLFTVLLWLSSLIGQQAINRNWGNSHWVFYNYDCMLSKFSANQHRIWSGPPLIFKVVYNQLIFPAKFC